MKTTIRVLIAISALALFVPAALATNDKTHKVDICHRTNSVTNPYSNGKQEVDASSVDGTEQNENKDHSRHTGEEFDFAADPDVKYPPPHNGDQWGDIIPPFYTDGTPGDWEPLNWDANGQAIWNADCNEPPEPSESPSESPSASPTPSPSPSPSPSPEPTPTPTPVVTPTPTPEVTPTPPAASFEVFVVTPVCDGDVPYLEYDVAVTNTEDTTVDITFINPTGDDVTYLDQPLSGRVLWPGAVVAADGVTPVDWPGWTQLANGTWVEGDEFDWVRPFVQVLFVVNPEQGVTIGYPPSSPNCSANPPANPNPPTQTLPPSDTEDISTASTKPTNYWLAVLLLFTGGALGGYAYARNRRR